MEWFHSVVTSLYSRNSFRAFSIEVSIIPFRFLHEKCWRFQSWWISEYSCKKVVQVFTIKKKLWFICWLLFIYLNMSQYSLQFNNNMWWLIIVPKLICMLQNEIYKQEKHFLDFHFHWTKKKLVFLYLLWMGMLLIHAYSNNNEKN